MNYNRFLSKISLLRQPSPIRYLIARSHNMFRLAGGLPNPDSFPIKAITLHLRDGSNVKMEDVDMIHALQYSNTEGIQPMIEWVKEHQIRRHKIRGDDWDVIITTGSQDAMSKTFEMLIDPGAGDPILVENPSYTGALASLYPLQPKFITVPIDEHGIIPSKLAQILEEHYANKNNKPIKFLYVIPTGQNPSGATLTAERKKKIYKLAQKYDFLILEDDPYYYLNFSSDKSDSEVTFLSMDVDGRVLRFDSLSKVLSSGLRIGWLTGPKVLIERIHLHMQTGSLHTSGLSQRVASKLLSQIWGTEGLENHVHEVQALYRKKRDEFIYCVDKYLKDHVTYSVPKAGMFLWLRFNDIPDSKLFIEERTRSRRVLLVPGQAFHPFYEPGPYVRASYSVETLENMELACSALAELCEEYKTEQKKSKTVVGETHNILI
jgi:kynurenine/2-aminoadipate aminotransferase